MADAQALWAPAGTYVNTASYGLPPRPASEALEAALEDWRGGRTSWEHWGVPGEEARASFARLVNVPVETVAIAANVSTFFGLIAASIPDGASVLAPEVEFTSLLFPFLVQADRGVSVRLVPAAELAGEIGRDTDVVAFSAVQMATGEVAELEAIATAADENDAMTVVDATQAIGWLPLDASRFDVVAAHGYKWLMSPRGTAFMAIRPERLADVTPHTAGWYAGEDPLATFFGPPLRLAKSARRLDTSPAWFMWVATAPALATIERIGVEAIHEHDLALANAVPGRPGTPAEQLRNRVLGRGGRGREARGRGHPGRRPGRAAADVVARLQHDGRRRADARRSLSLRTHRPTVGALSLQIGVWHWNAPRACRVVHWGARYVRAAARSSSQVAELDARAALRLAAGAFRPVDRVPARVQDDLDTALHEQCVDTGRL